MSTAIIRPNSSFYDFGELHLKVSFQGTIIRVGRARQRHATGFETLTTRFVLKMSGVPSARVVVKLLFLWFIGHGYISAKQKGAAMLNVVNSEGRPRNGMIIVCCCCC